MSLIERRINHEPVDYIIGQKEFYGVRLHIDRNVLIPRLETEILVDLAIQAIKQRQITNSGELITIADIGTGSGAIAIAISINSSNTRIYAADISENTLKVVQQNIEHYNLQDRIIPTKSNLMSSLPSNLDFIVANLPYVGEKDISMLPPEIYRYEPLIALNGGEDGTAIIHQLLIEARDNIKSDGCIMIEIGYGQLTEIKNLVYDIYGSSVKVSAITDLNGIPRVIKICLNQM